ncbi:hypothetical protein [Methanolobus chelungpuianus]|uniref:Uncharacterized protein n=1 Tax=Methanolobus chelungpuianus TaxID=502115 RepID=A0AAE3HB75_9EURY|nr:hypothetical protein [Methanolobus chelungpuianus]MCQ6962934.1 hypothetical protein [Methanolobus chelungpuianus]
MTNLWIRHLEKAAPEEQERGASFVNMLHSLSRTSGTVRRKLNIERHPQGRNGLASGVSASLSAACAEERPHKTEATGPVDESRPSPGWCAAEQDRRTELCKWTARSQHGYEAGADVPEEDYVQLLRLESGDLMLRYNVTGEEVFETVVTSPEEAESLILEDNMTTASLYPENPEFQWSKK